ncbi:MAG: branched-chain amino acid aminotransferase, partial [Chloroflexi bacterium]|nr:branched-chain amino acid aminotransferase [Chloroflexota bacterium]
VEEPLTRYDLYTADEVFLTGTAAEVVGVVRVDGRKIGCGSVGSVTKDVASRFKDLARRGG